MKFQPRLSLRWALPLGIALVFLALTSIALLVTVEQRHRQYVQECERDLLSSVQRLASLAEREIGQDATTVAADLTLLALDDRFALLAVLDPDGTVILANRQAWRGRPAAAVIPDFTPDRFKQAIQGRLPRLSATDDGLRLTALAPFSHPAPPGALRSQTKGVVLAIYDLARPWKDLRLAAITDSLLPIAGMLLVLGVVGVILNHLVSRPLATLERATREMAAGQRHLPLAESGPPEIARLSASFNAMASAIDQAQAALQASQERLAITLRSIGDALIATDTLQRVTLMNPVAEALTGWPAAEASGRPIGEVFRIRNARTGQPAEIPVERVIRDGKVVGLANHTVLDARDGSHYHIADSAAPIRDAGNRLIGVVMVFRDVSEEYQLRAALQASEMHFRALTDNGQALVLTTDETGECTYFNAPWLKYTGRTLAQESGRGILEGVHPEDRDRCITLFRAALARHHPFSLTFRLRRYDGSYRWFQNDGTPRFDEAGKFLGYVAHLLDVTPRVLLEARQTAQTHLLERIATDAPVEELLEELARFIESQAPGIRCSVLLAEPVSRTLRVAAAPGLPARYNARVNGLPIGEGNGSCGTAAARQQAVTVIDVREDPLWHAFQDVVAQEPWLQACWSTPFFDGEGQLLGTFALYPNAARGPNPDEQELTDFGSHLAGLIVSRHQATERLRILSRAVENSPAHIVITDTSGRITYINSRFSEVTGFSAQEAIGQPIRDLLRGQMDAENQARMWEQLRQGEDWRGVFHNLRKNGEPFWEWACISPIRNAEGRIILYSAVKEDITERMRADAEIHRLAFYDALTGLPNRRLFIDRLTQALAIGQRNQQFGALLFIDLDDFKRVNDARGHGVGDILLQQVARRLDKHLRSEDTVARLGGDEFVVLLNHLGTVEESAGGIALGVAEKLLASLDTPFPIDRTDYHLGASIGITLFPRDGQNVDDMLREADTAMYRAKAEGRNRISYFEPTMQAEVEERLDLEHQLREALRSEALTLYLQPQVDRDGRLMGAEALMRWNHPTRGLVPPAQFIPVAEESGLIVSLGEWALGRAAEMIHELAEAGTPLRIAVNVSPRQFAQADFTERVLTVLGEKRADPALLTLEVTEGLVIENIQDAAIKMSALSHHGVHFAIDDFGTGYSSLAYLKRLPLDELKIDKTFVLDAPRDPNDAALVETILAVARHLGFSVVAEGVETAAHLEFLKALDCPAFQGYYFDRPLPWEEFCARWPGNQRPGVGVNASGP